MVNRVVVTRKKHIILSGSPAEGRESREPLLSPMSSFLSRGHSLQSSPSSSGPSGHSLRSRLYTPSCNTCNSVFNIHTTLNIEPEHSVGGVNNNIG